MTAKLQRIVGIIPSRFASQRLPAKPLADILGKPMVQRVYERAKKSRLLTDVVVATDDERIVSAVKGFGGKAVMTPVTLQSGSDRISWAAKSIACEIVVNIQGDEPLIEPAMIDQTVQLLLDDPAATVATAVKRIIDPSDITNPNVVKAVLAADGYALYFSRSPVPHIRDGGAPEAWLSKSVYYKHFGIYAFRSAYLKEFALLSPTPLEKAEKLEQLRILEHGGRIKAAITECDSVPVDTAADLEKVRTIMKERGLK